MVAELTTIARPQRWDVPFGPSMSAAEVDRILSQPPFEKMDPARFPASLPLRGILQNDARLITCQKGDILVRSGDYLSSAFFVLSGGCKTEVANEGHQLDKALSREATERKSFFQVVAQLWRRPAWPEVRDPSRYGFDALVGKRGKGEETRIYLQDVQAVLDKSRTHTMGPGEAFGLTAALGRTAAIHTTFADQESEVVEIRWQGIRDLMRRDAALQQHIDQVFRTVALRSFLQNSPLFRHLEERELEELAQQAVFESYGSYDKVVSPGKSSNKDYEALLQSEPVIAQEGDYINGLVMVRNGLVRVSEHRYHGSRTVTYLCAGQTYGFDELSAAGPGGQPLPLKRTLRAIGYVNVVLIPTAAAEKYLFSRLPKQRLELTVLQPAARASKLPDEVASKLDTDLLEFIVEKRFVTGTASMVIDLNRCTRCDDCVRACASTHDNNPRFLRTGPTYGHYMVAHACMHCQDPVCMIECPTGAIHRDLTQGAVVVNDDTCIGCSACSRNCPYEAIRMVEIRDAKGNRIVDRESNQPIVKATKCNLCIDQHGGPACERACPHDAMKRVDMRDMEALAGWLTR